ncbi:MAG: 50S ribosomal protein L35 [Candidatus Uhrbacteria bacterium]|nr:50S ribosomal protein L35 [Candidatus Uhrbacteria bacterium]
MKQKTNKTISKRFRITSTGKLLRRKGGQNHFNGRESGVVTRNKRKDETMSVSDTKNIKTLIQNF